MHSVDGNPTDIAEYLLSLDAAVVLVCWEHHHVVDIAGALPGIADVTNARDIPTFWPDDRFDLIWRFDLNGDGKGWAYSLLDQRLVAGDRIS